MIKVQSDRGTNDGCKDKVDQGEHVVLLNFQIGKKEHNAVGQSRKADNGNDKQSKAVIDEQKIDGGNHNAAPNRNLDGLADAVEFNKIGGEDHLPNNEQRKNDNDAPKRAAYPKVYNRSGYRNAPKRPTNNIQHSFAVA